MTKLLGLLRLLLVLSCAGCGGAKAPARDVFDDLSLATDAVALGLPYARRLCASQSGDEAKAACLEGVNATDAVVKDARAVLDAVSSCRAAHDEKCIEDATAAAQALLPKLRAVLGA